MVVSCFLIVQKAYISSRRVYKTTDENSFQWHVNRYILPLSSPVVSLGNLWWFNGTKYSQHVVIK